MTFLSYRAWLTSVSGRVSRGGWRECRSAPRKVVCPVLVDTAVMGIGHDVSRLDRRPMASQRVHAALGHPGPMVDWTAGDRGDGPLRTQSRMDYIASRGVGLIHLSHFDALKTSAGGRSGGRAMTKKLSAWRS